MSFSANVKSEMLKTEASSAAFHAQCYALLLFGRSFSKTELSILTEHSEVANAYAEAIGHFSGKQAEVTVSAGGNYKVIIQDKSQIQTVLKALGYTDSMVKKRIHPLFFNDDTCQPAFVRGAFLASGTLTDPEKEYHLEFSMSSKPLCDDLFGLIEGLGLNPKQTVRGGGYVIYLKNSEEIEDLLAIMGATENSLAVMGAKMYKDIRNNVNRRVNFENANMQRSIQAALKQYDAIVKLQKYKGLESLPPELREIAQLRLENREAGNAEIMELLSAPLSLSGVNHRFRRLIQMAQEIHIPGEK